MTDTTTAVTPATDEEIDELLRWLGVHGHRLRTVVLGSGFIGDAHMTLLALIARIDALKAENARLREALLESAQELEIATGNLIALDRRDLADQRAAVARKARAALEDSRE